MPPRIKIINLNDNINNETDNKETIVIHKET
jgi:hypothetical protein